jgi:2-oxoglutarate ferredoxin oxidoreductase subunit alpha
MMEPVVLPEPRPEIRYEDIKKLKPWAVTGYGDDDSKRTVVKSLRMQPDELEKHVEKLFVKYSKAEKELVRVETVGVEDAEIVFVAFGTTARITKEAMELLAQQGIKTGLVRPISLWPFPYDAFDMLTDKTKVVISAEMSMGQLIQDVRIGVGKRFPIKLINRTGGMIPTSLEISERAKKILEEIGGSAK